MRGLAKTDQMLKARDLNYDFIGSPFVVDLPDGTEFSSSIAGLEWKRDGVITVHVPVQIGPDGQRFLELPRESEVVVPYDGEE